MITFCKLVLKIWPKNIRQRFQFSNDVWTKINLQGQYIFWIPCIVQTRGNCCWLHALFQSYLTNLLEIWFQARQQQLFTNSNAGDSNLLTIMTISFIVILGRTEMNIYWNREDSGSILYFKVLAWRTIISRSSVKGTTTDYQSIRTADWIRGTKSPSYLLI